MQTVGRALVAVQTGSGKMKQFLTHKCGGGGKEEEEGLRDGKDKQITLHLCFDQLCYKHTKRMSTGR